MKLHNYCKWCLKIDCDYKIFFEELRLKKKFFLDKKF